MSGYHKLTGPYKIRTLKNWLLCFGWFSVREILVKLTLYWVVQLADVSCVQNVYLARWGSHSTADKWPCKLGNWSFFFPKSRKFQVKMENGIKWNSLDSRHVFQSFSLPRSNKRAQKAIFGITLQLYYLQLITTTMHLDSLNFPCWLWSSNNLACSNFWS